METGSFNPIRVKQPFLFELIELKRRKGNAKSIGTDSRRRSGRVGFLRMGFGWVSTHQGHLQAKESTDGMDWRGKTPWMRWH